MLKTILTLDNSGNVERDTFTEDHMPKMAFVYLLVRAFEIQGASDWNENFTASTKRQIIAEFNLEKEPMALGTFYKNTRVSSQNPSILARIKAFELYTLGIKAS